jgi:undecaprenyl-diphosphatase
MDRLRRRWLIASIVGFAWFLAVAADVASQGRLAALDAPVGAWAASHVAGAERIAALALDDAGSVVGVVLALAALAGFLFWRRRRFDALRVVLAGILVEIAIEGFKRLFARPRPSGALIAASGYGFPSGHATAAAMLACLLAWYASTALRARWQVILVLLVGLGWALLMAWSRVALGVHHFTDVLAGLGLGVAATGAVLAIRLPGRSSPHPQETSSRNRRPGR